MEQFLDCGEQVYASYGRAGDKTLQIGTVADWPTGTPGNFPVRPWLIHSLTPLFEHNFEENDKTIEVKLYMERY